jgi:hypothetical protein
MSRHSWLKLQGTRYRCTPLYVQFDELDPLLNLFLQVIEYEHSVARLVRAFGLTERIVEDILGELIRRNRVTLVITDKTKELRILEGGTPTPMREPGDTLDVWQESTTGLVLPAWVVDPYAQPRGGRGESVATESIRVIREKMEFVEAFLSAPDSQLIDMLIRTDDGLRGRDEGYASLDRLTNRYRVRPQMVWLPVVEAEVQGTIVPLINAKRIPNWVARVWSTALRRADVEAQGDVDEFYTAGTTEEESWRLVHGWRLEVAVGSWRRSVDDLLHLIPAPRSGYELREVREAQSALIGKLLSVAQAQIPPFAAAKANATWFDDVLNEARDWAILVLRSKSQIEGVIRSIQRRVQEGHLPTSLVLVVPAGLRSPEQRRTLQELMGSARSALMTTLAWPATGPAVALSDGPTVLVRYASTSAALRFSGHRIAAEWLAIVQGMPAANDHRAPEEEAFHHVYAGRRTVRLDDTATLGVSAEALTLGQVIDRLRGFQETLLTAIVDPEGLAHEAGWDVPEAPETTLSKISGDQSLLQRLPGLAEQCDELQHHLSLAPAPPWAFFSRLAGHELLATLVALLSEPDRRVVEGDIHILTEEFGQLVASPVLLRLLEHAVLNQGWNVTIGLPHPEGGINATLLDVVSRLRTTIPSPRLQFRLLGLGVPAHAIVIDNLVFLAGGDWLSQSVLTVSRRSDFGFAFENWEMAETLRTCFAGATELDVRAASPV